MEEIAGNSLLAHKAPEQATAPGKKPALEMERTSGMKEEMESSLLVVNLQLNAVVINMNQGEKVVSCSCFNFASFKRRSWEIACLVTEKLSH